MPPHGCRREERVFDVDRLAKTFSSTIMMGSMAYSSVNSHVAVANFSILSQSKLWAGASLLLEPTMASPVCNSLCKKVSPSYSKLFAEPLKNPTRHILGHRYLRCVI